MAKIGLVAFDLSPMTMALAQGLSQLRHEVIIYTSQDQVLPENLNNIQILTPFNKWSLKEAFLLAPHFLRHRIDILHFVFTKTKEQAKPAHWFLLSLHRKSNVASFWGHRLRARMWRWNPFLKFCDAVTFGTRESLMYFKRKELLSDDSITDVIPALDLRQAGDQKNKSIDEDLQKLVELKKGYILVPAHASAKTIETKKLGFLFSTVPVIFMGQRSDLLASHYEFSTTGILNEFEKEFLIQNCKALLIAFHEFSLSELSEFSSLARQYKIPMFVSSEQYEAFPGLILPEKTGWVLHEGAATLQQILRSHPSLKLPPWPESWQRFELVDSTMNEINRLYIRTLTP